MIEKITELPKKVDFQNYKYWLRGGIKIRTVKDLKYVLEKKWEVFRKIKKEGKCD